ncbi:MAG TPA: LON peptidase substrate-binding domain-containing protein, partial [Casimicrobiaceae bacterium]|nr:LON peptidase substrate-binding domain-containing protein [Casimicrobiaceae bacterium]
MIEGTRMASPDDRSGAGAPGTSHIESPGPMAGMPADALIIVPVRNLVLFPGLVAPLVLNRARGVAAAQEAVRTERPIGLVLQRNPETETPGPRDLYTVGTVASVLRYVTAPDGTHNLVCHGQQRFRIAGFVPDMPFDVARVEILRDSEEATTEIEARVLQVRARATELLELMPRAPAELQVALEQIKAPGALADFIAGLLDIKPAEKQAVLETFDLSARLDMVLRHLLARIEVTRLSREIGEQTQERLEQRQREILLREQMKTIQKELGETDETAAETKDLEEKIGKAQMPDEVEKHARKELKRLQQMAESSPEYSMVRTYLEWLVELPWGEPPPDRIEIE